MQNLWLHVQQNTLLWSPRLIEILDPNHLLVKLRDEIPFEEMVEILSSGYSRSQWAPSKSIRKMIALELLKKRYKYSDKELVSIANTDLAVMYFCGYEYPTLDTTNSSTMTKFRNRITPEMAQMIQDVAVWKQLKKLHRRKRTSVQTDTTCIPENMKYPTDTWLLWTCAEKLFEVIEDVREKLWSHGKNIIIRWKRTFKKMIKKFIMKRKKSKKEIQKMRKTLVRKVKKYTSQAKENLNLLQEKSKLLREKTNVDNLLETINTIVAQQEEMIRKGKNQVANRILSLHKPYVRPIYRWKAKAKTEFWPKTTMSLIWGRVTIINAMENENISDTEMPLKAIKDYERIAGKPPWELSTDRWWHSPANHRLLKEKWIVDGIQYRGRIPKKNNLPSPVTRKRLAKGRSPMEWFIGVGKRKYGLDKITYSENNRLWGVICGTTMMNYCVNI